MIENVCDEKEFGHFMGKKQVWVELAVRLLISVMARDVSSHTWEMIATF